MSDWRRSYHVLVVEAQTIGSVAVIRSLGRAGYRVIASSPQADALGFCSRYCHAASVQPPYGESEQFFAWLDEVLRREQINLIIPSESFLLAVRPRFAELQPLLPVPKDENLVYRALSKWDLFQTFVDGGLTDHLPPFCLIDEDDALPTASELRALGEPLFLKVDGLYSRDGSGGDVIKCENSDIAVERLKTLHARYRKVLVQGHVRGIGVGAFLAQWQGRLLGEFMHRRIHEVPHTGGVSSFRAAWRHLPIMVDAKARAAHLGWQGAGMFEYRWDPTSDHFFLMEFNSRFWGSLHLAMFAGVDFPRLLADALFNHANPQVTDYHLIRCRLTFPGEVQYVWSCLKDASLGWSRRLWPLLDFAVLGLDPRVYSDLTYPGDRALYWRMMVRSMRRFLS